MHAGTPLQSTDRLHGVQTGSFQANAVALLRRASNTLDITASRLPNKAAVSAPKDVKSCGCSLPIRRILVGGWQRVAKGVRELVHGAPLTCTLTAETTLADLPVPPEGEHRVLAARQAEDGSIVLRWSRKEKPPQAERDLAGRELRRLVENEVRHLENEPKWHGTVRHKPGWIASRIVIKPEHIVETRQKLEEAHQGVMEEAAERMVACVLSRRSAPPAEPRFTRFVEFDDGDEKYAMGAAVKAEPVKPTETKKTGPQLQESAEEDALIDEFLSRMPAPVMEATHALCRHIASSIDKLGLSDLAQIQAGVKDEIVEHGSWWQFKEWLAEPPADGWACCQLQNAAVKLLAARSGEPQLLSSAAGRMELLQDALKEAPRMTRIAIDKESVFLGTVLAFRHAESTAHPEEEPEHGIDFEALSKAVRNPQTRAALERLLGHATDEGEGVHDTPVVSQDVPERKWDEWLKTFEEQRHTAWYTAPAWLTDEKK